MERLRMPASRLAAGTVALVALFTVPRHFESVFGELMELTGFVLLILAALGRIWCSIYISGRKDHILCTEGPYSISRNPLYFFSFLGVIGFALALQSLLILLISVPLYLAYYHFVMKGEAFRLNQMFGASYVAYINSTPRFFPAFRPIKPIESYVINPRVIERGMKEVVWFPLAIILIDALALIHSSGYMIFTQLPF